MAYSTHTDVRLHAPQAPDGEDFAGYIAQADRVIDGALRVNYEVPFTTVPDLIVNVSSKLAAAEFLKAQYAAINREPPEHADRLYRDALDMLAQIKADPSILGLDLKAEDVGDYERNRVETADGGTEFFTTGPETEWG